MNIGELWLQLGVNGDTKGLDEFQKKVKETGKAIEVAEKKLQKWVYGSEEAAAEQEALSNAFKKYGKELLILGGVIAGAYIALDRLTDSLAKQNLQWLNLTRQSDIALDTFQKWGTIGKIVGVDNAAQQLENLNQKIFNLRLTGEGAKGFQMAGIMPTNAEDVLEQLRGRVAGMNNTAASYLLQQMGLDPKMITLLRMGREEWEQYLKIQKEYTLNEDQRREIDRMNRQLEVARIKMQYLKDKVLLALMPTLVRISNVIGNIASGIEKVHRWVTKSSSGWATFTRVILGVLGGAIALTAVLKTVPAIIMAITVGVNLLRNALLLLSAHPIIAGLTLLVSTIMLIADDIIGYNNGKNSLIGAIINGLEDLNLKGFIDFPVPKWLEYMIRFIDYVVKHHSLINLDKMLRDAGIDPETGTKIRGVENFPQGVRSPAAAVIQEIQNNGTNRTANNTTNQEIKVYTTADTLKDITSLPYLKQQVIYP